MSLEDFNFACAYIQLLGEEPPSLSFIDDVIGEEEAYYFLQKFYGAKPLDINSNIDSVIDLHENREDIASRCHITDVKRFAVCNARHTMVEYLHECSEKNILTCSNQSQEVYKKDLSRLRLFLKGQTIEENWVWQNLAGKDLTGLRIEKAETPALLKR